MNVPLFSSRIVMVHPAELKSREPKNRALSSDEPWLIDGRVSLQPEGYTDGAYNCNIVVIHNGDRATVAHINPERRENSHRAIKRALRRDIAELKKSGRPVRAVITGGRGYSDPLEPKSARLLGWIKKLLAEKNVPYSVIWGAANSFINAATTGAYCLPEQDLVMISNGAVSPDSLPNDFVVQHIAEGDTFEALLGKMDFRIEESRPAQLPDLASNSSDKSTTT